MRYTRTALATAGAIVIGMGAAALPAAAHDGKRAERDGARADKPAKADRGHVGRRDARACKIASDRLLTPETHAGLARLKERLDARVADERITQERADRVMARRAKKVTLRVAVRTARWAPIFDLFDVEGDTHRAKRMALRDMRREAGGMRALLEDKDLTVSDLRKAVRAGRAAGRAERRDLCGSGRTAPTPSKEAPPSSEDPATAA